MSDGLRTYIEEARRKGLSDDAIRGVLLNLGHAPEDISAALVTTPVQKDPGKVHHIEIRPWQVALIAVIILAFLAVGAWYLKLLPF